MYEKGYERGIFFFLEIGESDTVPLPKIERNKFEVRRELPRYRRQPVAPYLRLCPPDFSKYFSAPPRGREKQTGTGREEETGRKNGRVINESLSSGTCLDKNTCPLPRRVINVYNGDINFN